MTKVRWGCGGWSRWIAVVVVDDAMLAAVLESDSQNSSKAASMGSTVCLLLIITSLFLCYYKEVRREIRKCLNRLGVLYVVMCTDDDIQKEDKSLAVVQSVVSFVPCLVRE